MNNTCEPHVNTINAENVIIDTLSKLSKEKRIIYCLENGLNFDDYKFRLRKFKTKK